MAKGLEMNPETLYEQLLLGDRTALARAITLVESGKDEHRALADALLQRCTTINSNTWRVAISGVPGVGKSTFIDAFGSLLTAQGRKVAVLAIDPSSELGHGSILGDKTRMERLSQDPNAFIRPSPSSGNLGGVARSTRASILLCEVAGFDVVLIETVGVGQSETVVRSMVDMFMLLALPGAGDELQGIKRGIMEMADLLVINKDDGPQHQMMPLAKAAYLNALHLFPARADGWTVPVVACSSVEGTGIDRTLAAVTDFFDHCSGQGLVEYRRQEQMAAWFDEQLTAAILSAIHSNQLTKNAILEMRSLVTKGQVSVTTAVHSVLDPIKRKLAEG